MLHSNNKKNIINYFELMSNFKQGTCNIYDRQIIACTYRNYKMLATEGVGKGGVNLQKLVSAVFCQNINIIIKMSQTEHLSFPLLICSMVNFQLLLKCSFMSRKPTQRYYECYYFKCKN